MSLLNVPTVGVESACGGSPLVDKNYYTDVYKGAEVDDDLGVLLDRSSDIVRQHTLYLLDDIEIFPESIQENIKKAVCAQAEFINANGGLDSLNSDSVSSFSIGKFSVTGGSKNLSGKSSAAISAAPLMLSYLESAGMLYRGKA